jgi:PIN domain nuclease of toxin-antitoxin system
MLIWAGEGPERVPDAAVTLILDADSIYFSVISIWEIAIKNARKKPGFQVDPDDLRQALLASGYIEIHVTGGHACMAGRLPPIHKDPFDRMLVAQATSESLTLLTADSALAGYGANIRVVKR